MGHIEIYLLALVIPLIAQILVKTTYSKYKKQNNSKNITGYDVARSILDKNKLKDMYIVETDGIMSDHYDPKRKTIRLSNEVYNGTSIASLSIGAHECGHAIQDKEGYFMMKIRSFIFPIVNLGTKFAYIVLLIGLVLELMDLVWLAIILVSLGLIFQLVTLPVEYNASARAKKEINKLKLANNKDLHGVNKMLGAAALTYVAGVLASALEILRLVLVFTNRD